MDRSRAGGALVGRSVELAAVQARLDRGAGAVLVASPGVGASRLMRDAVAGRGAASIVATASSGTIPLGAFLPVIAPDDVDVLSGSDHDVLGIASRVRRDLGARGRVIAVDDAHLLDPASAGLLLELARAGASVVATVREGAAVHDAVRALWSGGFAQRIRLAPLDADATTRLVAALLHGPVDPGLARAVHDRSGGVPLFVRAVVDRLLADTRIALDDDVWMLRGTVPEPLGIADLVQESLPPAPAGAQTLLELLALADGLDLEVALVMVEPGVLEDAEGAELVRLDAGPAGDRLVLAHPFYRDAVLERLPALRRRRLLRQLIDASRSRDPARPEGIARSAQITEWRLELGDPVDPAELLDVAELVQRADPRHAPRFISALRATRLGDADRLRLAGLLAHQHRTGDAEAVLTDLDRAGSTPPLRMAALVTRAYLQVMPLHAPAAADAALSSAIDEHGPLPVLLAHRATAMWKLGRLDQASREARAVFDDAGADVDARAHAGLTLVSVLVHAASADGGLRADGVALRRQVGALVRAARGLPEGDEALGLIEASAALVDHDPRALGDRARAGWARALGRGDDAIRAQYAFLLGWAECQGGDLAAGLDHLGEHHRARGVWRETMGAFAGGYHVRALAAAGRVADATALLAELETGRIAPLYLPHLAVARAAVLAASGAVDEGIRVARRAGDAAEGQGHGLVARDAWDLALRCGDDLAARHLVDRPRLHGASALRGDHARAWLTRDADALDAVVVDLADAGHILWALDAAAQATLVRGRDERGRSATRLAELRRLAPDAQPALHPASRSDGAALTGRELEIARLAGADRTDREIAALLGISVRTVNTHLGRVYAKLGVRGRSSLPSRL